MSKRVYKPKCSCQLRLVDGKCPAGCEAHRQTRAQTLSLNRKLRERERRAVAPIGLTPDMARDGYEKSGLDSSYSKMRALGAARARRAWARKGVSK